MGSSWTAPLLCVRPGDFSSSDAHSLEALEIGTPPQPGIRFSSFSNFPHRPSSQPDFSDKIPQLPLLQQSVLSTECSWLQPSGDRPMQPVVQVKLGVVEPGSLGPKLSRKKGCPVPGSPDWASWHYQPWVMVTAADLSPVCLWPLLLKGN